MGFGKSVVRAVVGNPVTMKELRARMRGVRTYVILTIYLALISGLVGSILV